MKNMLNKFKKSIFSLSTIAFIILSNPMNVFASKKNGIDVNVTTSPSFWAKYQAFYGEYKLYLNIFIAISMLVDIGILAYHFVQLGNSASNPQKKQEAISNIAIATICVVLQGALAVIMALLYFFTNPLS